MILKYILAIVVIIFSSFAHTAHILGIIPTASYSHQVAFIDLWKHLSLRGHKVTVITTDPQKDEKLTNLTEIDLHLLTYEFFKGIHEMAEKPTSIWKMLEFFHKQGLNVSEAQLSSPKVQDLIHSTDKNFDVLLLESFYPEYLGFAEKYNCPSILINSLDAFTNIHYKMGNTGHPILYPNIGVDFQYPLNFKERIISTIYWMYTSLFYDYKCFAWREQQMKRFFNTTSTIQELLDKVDMLFLTVNPIIQPIRAIGPSTINIGGLRQMPAKPLPKDLEEFLDNATNGFVYFSLGSNVKSKELQKESLEAIADALSELPYKVLWKFEDESAMPRKFNNVKLIKWAPQLGVLAHPNLKVFVTQGGLQSMEEGIHYEVPFVVIPFFTEQEQNARLMARKGIAVSIGRRPHIQKEELRNAIHEAINNPKYRDAVKSIKRLSADTPMTGLEKAIWWTEYVIRNKGAKHLRNPAADLPLYQYYLLDVVGFLILAVVAIISVLVYLLEQIYSLLQNSSLVNSNLHKKIK